MDYERGGCACTIRAKRCIGSKNKKFEGGASVGVTFPAPSQWEGAYKRKINFEKGIFLILKGARIGSVGVRLGLA